MKRKRGNLDAWLDAQFPDPWPGVSEDKLASAVRHHRSILECAEQMLADKRRWREQVTAAMYGWQTREHGKEK